MTKSIFAWASEQDFERRDVADKVLAEYDRLMQEDPRAAAEYLRENYVTGRRQWASLSRGMKAMRSHAETLRGDFVTLSESLGKKAYDALGAELAEARERIEELEAQGQRAPKIRANSAKQNIFSVDDLVKGGKPFYSDKRGSKGNVGLAVALQQALKYAGPDGVVASMPFLIAGRAMADKDNYLWKTWVDVLSEEDVGIDKKGSFVSQGKPVLVILHGGGILTTERIHQAYADGLTARCNAKFIDEEFDDLLNGVLPNGERVQLYTVDDVRHDGIPDPFGRYGVVMDYEVGKATRSGRHTKEEFMENPLVLARAGTPEHLDAYFEKANISGRVRSFHSLNAIDPSLSQGHVMALSNGYVDSSDNYALDRIGLFLALREEQ